MHPEVYDWDYRCIARSRRFESAVTHTHKTGSNDRLSTTERIMPYQRN